MATFVILCLLSYARIPTEKESTLKVKNWLPLEANSFLLYKIPFQMGEETISA